MLRKKLAIPAAAIVALGGTIGMLRPTGLAHARVSADSYAGTITITDWQVPDGTSLGGASSGTVVDQEISGALLSYILGYDQNGNLYPDIATQVPTTTNGGVKVVNGDTVVTVHLTPNQKWSDGSPITDADYVAGLLIDFSPDVSLTSQIDQIRTLTIANNTLTYTYKGLFAPAVSLLAVSPPVPWEYYEKKYSAPVTGLPTTSWTHDKETDPKTGLIPASTYASSGLKKLVTAYLADYYNKPSDLFNGPYKIGGWVADQRYTLVPNTYYTLHSGQAHPRPATIQFVVVSEDNAALQRALATDQTYSQIDKAEDFQLTDLPTLKQSKYIITVLNALQFEHLELNTSHKPLNDVRVRQALDYAIDKYAYLSHLFTFIDNAQAHQLALGSIFPSSHPNTNKSLPGSNYNPAKARALLAAAGFANTPGTGPSHVNLDFYTTSTAAARLRSGQILQRYWAQVGINVRLHFVKATGGNSLFNPYQDGGVLATGRFDIAEFAYEISPDPDGTLIAFDPSQIPGPNCPTCGNDARVNDPKLWAYVVQGRHTLDAAQRNKVYQDLQAYFATQDYWIMLYTRPEILLHKPTLGNFKPNITSQGQEWNTWEWYRAAAS